MKLKTELLGLILLVAMLPALMLSLGWGWFADHKVKELFYQRDRHLIHEATEPFADYLEELKHEVHTLAAMPIFQTLEWQHTIRPVLDAYLSDHSDRFSKLFMGLANGHLYATSSLGNPYQGGLITHDDSVRDAAPKLINKRRYWQEVVANNTAAEPLSTISEPIYSITTGDSQIAIASSIISPQGDVLGLIGATVEWTLLQQRIQQVSERLKERLNNASKIALVYKDGSYAYHWQEASQPRVRLSQQDPVINSLFDDFDSIESALVEKILSGSEGVAWDVDSTNELVMYAPLRNTGYTIVIFTSAEDYFKPLTDFRNKTYLVFVLALMLALFLSNHLLRRVFRPISRIQRFTQKVISGRSSQFEPLSIDNEIGRLECHLAEMTEKLKSRSDRIKVAFNSAVDAVVNIDSEGIVLDWNPAAETLFGYSREAMVGSNIDTIIPQKFRCRHRSQLALATDLHYSVDSSSKEVQAIHADGSEVFVELTLSKWTEGDQPYFTGVLRDIRERKNYESLLAKISDRLSGKTGKDYVEQLALGLADAFDAKYALISLLDPVTQSATTVSACCGGQVIDNFNYELYGSPCYDVFEKSVDDSGVCVIADSTYARYPQDTMLTEMAIESYAGCGIKDKHGNTIAIMAVMDCSAWDDVALKRSVLKLFAARVSTELERMEYEKSLTLAATAFETFEGIVITDANGEILKANRAFSHITGYSEAEVIGKNPRILQSGKQGDEFYKEMWRTLTSQGFWQGEIWNRRKSGELYPQWLRISTVKDRRGEVSNYVATCLDTKQQLRQREEIERRGAEEQVVGKVLNYGIQPIDLKLFLQHSLDVLVAETPWISASCHSSIFLVDQEDPGRLTRMAIVSRGDCVSAVCRTLKIGECLCGQAAQHRAAQYTMDLSSTLIKPAADKQQGIYAIPIQDGEVLQGVLQVGLPSYTEKNSRQEPFLQRVSDVLSLGISKRHSDEQLEYLAFHDALTGLANRVSLKDRVNQANSSSQRRGEFVGVIYIDLDHFKNVNDVFGHSVGDQLLIQVSDRFSRCIRAEDTLARIGGDEFVVWLPLLGTDEMIAGKRVESVSKKILDVIKAPFLIEGHSVKTSCSMGGLIEKASSDDVEQLMKCADTAMYGAKAAGRGQFQFFHSDMQEAVLKRLELERALAVALERQEFHLLYQPQVDSKGQLLSAEALIRWDREGRGIVSPLDFIPIAEETGMIIPIGEWVIRSACHFICELKQQGTAIPISVNVSAKQFRHEGFIESLQEIIEQTGVNPHLLGIELTESLLVDDVEKTRIDLQRIRALGIKVSIDDFGTGYSALSYLKDLPIDVLKVDRVFVKNLHLDSNCAAIAEAILAMSKNLGLGVVAEGIELVEELDFLTDRECSVFQGFFFSKPLSSEDFKSYSPLKKSPDTEPA